MKRISLFAGVAVLAVVGFLLFRPDTLFTDVRADESLEDAFGVGEVSAVATTGTVTNTTGTVTTTTRNEIEVVLTGSFAGIDHRASGTAAIYGDGDRFVLRFEDDTDIQNGPDLYVWLLASDSYQGGDPGEHLDLGVLTGNVGGQNYELPEGFDPALHRTVLIWCLRFAVPFAAASLS
ncbi:MAG: DM13 domain-containing protein [Acidimicrobiia bacterium]